MPLLTAVDASRCRSACTYTDQATARSRRDLKLSHLTSIISPSFFRKRTYRVLYVIASYKIAFMGYPQDKLVLGTLLLDDIL